MPTSMRERPTGLNSVLLLDDHLARGIIVTSEQGHGSRRPPSVRVPSASRAKGKGMAAEVVSRVRQQAVVAELGQDRKSVV